jgi:hypothetical protein
VEHSNPSREEMFLDYNQMKPLSNERNIPTPKFNFTMPLKVE